MVALNIQKLRDEAKGISILVVEDSDPIRKQICRFLEKFFTYVFQAQDGEKGLEMFELNKPDIIVTDLNMPKMDGHEMIKAIKNISKNTPIIITSAHSNSETLLESIHLGIVDFVPKPVDFVLIQEALLKAIKQLNKEQ
ncbi:MAG: response regulator [Campylobacteraceae bacterium]|nr:response regulator [Campylobacteraceae bacterium]